MGKRVYFCPPVCTSLFLYSQALPLARLVGWFCCQVGSGQAQWETSGTHATDWQLKGKESTSLATAIKAQDCHVLHRVSEPITVATELGNSYLAGLSYMTTWKLGVGSADLHFLRENKGKVPWEAKGY